MKRKPILMWGGFVSGRLHVYQDSVDGRRACLFQSKERAKLAYTDVRLLKIVPVRSK